MARPADVLALMEKATRTVETSAVRTAIATANKVSDHVETVERHTDDCQQPSAGEIRRLRHLADRITKSSRVHETMRKYPPHQLGRTMEIMAVELRIRERRRQTATQPVRSRPPAGRAPRRACNARRQGSRRTIGTGSRAGPSDDDGESEPPGLRLWRHRHFGNRSPGLLRVGVGS